MVSEPSIEDVRDLMHGAGIDVRAVAAIPGGWASWTFDIDGAWILRIARRQDVAAAHRRELRLLPLLADAVSFAVPRPEHVGEWAGHVFLAYRKIAGRALEPGDAVIEVAAMLRALHGFPADVARNALGCAGTTEEWRHGYADLWRETSTSALPLLDGELRDVLAARYAAFLAGAGDFTPVLVHRDLGVEHVLVDPATRRPVGLIDFEDAAVGDPAIDFAGLLASLGGRRTQEVLDAYGGPVGLERVRDYWWIGSLHAVLYGVRFDDAAIRDDGIAGLRGRLLG